MFLALAGSVGEPISARVAAIDQKARLYPPKRSPWHGNADAALKVTLWNGNGTGLPQKLRVDANLGRGRARDFYWFDSGKVTYGTQARWSEGESIERKLTFVTVNAKMKLAAVQERRAASDRALAAAAFHDVSPEELAKVGASVTQLLQQCLKAPGLRDRKATVKAVEADRIVLETAPGVEAWISRRAGDNVAPSLIGRPVTYDFTAVELDGQERDFLNGLHPVGKAPAVPPKAMLASTAPAPAPKAVTALAPPATPTVEAPAKIVAQKKAPVRKGARKKVRKRAPVVQTQK